MFGKGVVEQACKSLDIDLIIRAHQVVQDGYEMMTGRRLITVFSVPNYCAQFTNSAAVVCLNANLQVTLLEFNKFEVLFQISFQQMTAPPLPDSCKAKAAPAIAVDTNLDVARADKETIKPYVKEGSKEGGKAWNE